MKPAGRIDFADTIQSGLGFRILGLPCGSRKFSQYEVHEATYIENLVAEVSKRHEFSPWLGHGVRQAAITGINLANTHIWMRGDFITSYELGAGCRTLDSGRFDRKFAVEATGAGGSNTSDERRRGPVSVTGATAARSATAVDSPAATLSR